MATTSMFAKIRKLGTSWHALCYCVRLLACGCQVACLASYPGLQVLACHSMDTSLSAWPPYSHFRLGRCFLDDVY